MLNMLKIQIQILGVAKTVTV